MKILDGAELVSFIKVRQLKQVRNLRQSHKIIPRLAIVKCGGNLAVDRYIGVKQRYAEDILVEVDTYDEDMDTLPARLKELSKDESLHGVILQLPIEDTSKTDEMIDLINPNQDVDGLTGESPFDAATPMAINWLLSGYGVELGSKSVAIVGSRGRLVGAPLLRMFKNSNIKVEGFDIEDSDRLAEVLPRFDIIISATGSPRIITSQMVKKGGVVVDAGTANEGGVLVGDVEESVRERDDISITPIKGGVGPLTVAALFDNVITSARRQAELKSDF